MSKKQKKAIKTSTLKNVIPLLITLQAKSEYFKCATPKNNTTSTNT